MAAYTWTVAELCHVVGGVVDEAFPDEMWVLGEISGIRRSPKGHLYFDLVEATGEERPRWDTPRIPVVAFQGRLRGIEAVLQKVGDLRLEDGLEVRIRGRLEYYVAQGRVQLLMEAIDPRHTLGQLVADRSQVVQRLREAGVFDANKGVPLPLVPLRVGLVTSYDSAAFNDFIHELESSRWAFEVTIADARVQGAEAEESLVAALAAVTSTEVDVVAIVRGGGSRTDLIAFDTERVARAVATCSAPVLVGIGHEIDRSVVDEVAHLSVKTPTACARTIVDRIAAFSLLLDERAHRTARAAHSTLSSRTSQLEGRAHRVRHAAPIALTNQNSRTQRLAGRLETLTRVHVAGASSGLDRRRDRLVRASTVVPERARRQLAQSAMLVRAVHPERTLARGYSITRTSAGAVVRSAEAIDPGDGIEVELAVGAISATVTGNRRGAPTP